MARIIIIGVSEVSRTQISRLLASSGYAVFRLCASTGELRRALTECGDGIVVAAGGLKSGQLDDVAADFGSSFQFLLIDRTNVLESYASSQVFKLSYPCSGNAVLGAIEMLTQLHMMKMPHRSGAEKDLVEKAKSLLMREYGIVEPEAHRRIQQLAMRRGMRMSDYAAQLLQGRNDDA